ncbi:MAG: hypothetical protein Q9196_006551, partial [Gyalolechia fulgens]
MSITTVQQPTANLSATPISAAEPVDGESTLTSVPGSLSFVNPAGVDTTGLTTNPSSASSSAPPASPPSITPSSSPNVPSSSSSANKIGLGTGLGLGIPLLLLVAGILLYILWRHRLLCKGADRRMGNELGDAVLSSVREKRNAAAIGSPGNGLLPELDGKERLPELHGEDLKELHGEDLRELPERSTSKVAVLLVILAVTYNTIIDIDGDFSEIRSRSLKRFAQFLPTAAALPTHLSMSTTGSTPHTGTFGHTQRFFDVISSNILDIHEPESTLLQYPLGGFNVIALAAKDVVAHLEGPRRVAM